MKQKAKIWFLKHRTDLVALNIFFMLVLVTTDLPWISSIAMGICWASALWLRHEVKGWQRFAFHEMSELEKIQGALKNSGMQMVTYCPICHQKITNPEEHRRKVHTTTKESK